MAGEPRPVQVAAGPLDAALSALSAQTGEQLLYTPDLVAGRQAPALSGRYTAEEALRRLLGDGVEVARAGPRSLVLRRRGVRGPATPAREADGRPFDAEPAGGPAAAGDPAPPAPAGDRAEPVLLEAVEVTGSHIRGEAALASPLLVIDRDELERSGHGTVAAALAVLPQNFAGTTSEGTSATGTDRTGANANYGTGLNLRGLGSDATLTLVNGRRMGGAGAKGDFADISTIPSAAVARVEVLLDGASALYGSDAVGGVVNIVLRRDFDGAETQLLGGTATAGEPWEARVSQIVGRRWSGGGAWATYELHHRAALPGAARAFAASADLRPLGGRDWRGNAARPGTILMLDPTTGATVPGWAIPAGQDGTALRPSDLVPGGNLGDQREEVDILPEHTRHSVLAFAHQAVGLGLELEAEARWGYRRYALAAGTPAPILSVNRSNPYFVSPNGSASHQIAYSLVGEIPPIRPQGSAESLGLTLGATLDLPGDWQARGHAAFAQEIGEHRTTGSLNSTYLAEALGGADRPETPFSARRDGYFNPFIGMGGQSPAVLAFITQGFSTSRTVDRLATANLQADGTVLQLPGGPLKLALGGQARRETFRRDGASFSSGFSPTRIQPVDAERLVLAAYAEARVPIVGDDNGRPGLRRLELSLAGRYERYDDVGSSADPKVGVLWSPAEGLAVRATYGTSFRAPGLRQTRDLELYSPSFLPLRGATVLSLVQTGGNPDLKPETATSWSVGVDWTPPGSGLRLSATLFDTRFEDRIDQPARVALGTVLADPDLSSFVRRISPATAPADLALIEALLASPNLVTTGGTFPAGAFGAIVDARYVNTATVRVRGLDLTGAYALEAAGGDLRLAGNLSWLMDFEQQLTPTSARRDRAGVANFPSRLRARASADWSRGPFGANLAVNHADDSRSLTGRHIRSQTTFDLQVRWAPPDRGPLAGTALVASVRNLFDRDPPFHDSELGVGYDPANADPIGRYVSLQLTKRW